MGQEGFWLAKHAHKHRSPPQDVYTSTKHEVTFPRLEVFQEIPREFAEVVEATKLEGTSFVHDEGYPTTV